MKISSFQKEKKTTVAHRFYMHTLWLCAVLINHVKLTMAAPSKNQGTDSNAHHHPHPHHPILLMDEITNKNFTVRFGNKIKLGKLYSLILNQKENLALNLNLLDLYMLQWRCINLAPLHSTCPLPQFLNPPLCRIKNSLPLSSSPSTTTTTNQQQSKVTI